MNKKIIAILGLPGSGKTETIEYLMKKHNWPKVYFGDVVFDEMKRLGLEINEQNERATREGLREKYGRLHFASKVIDKINNLTGTDVILVESLYDWKEYLKFKEDFGDDFFTIAVYVSPKTRYRRLGVRHIRPLTPEVAQSRDYAQIENISQAGPIAMANYTLNNEEDGIEHLERKIDEVIRDITTNKL